MVDDLAVLLSKGFADATVSIDIPRRSAAGPGEPGEMELPAGTLTFLLTEIEGSSRRCESAPEAMEAALQRHDRLLAEVIEGHGGAVITYTPINRCARVRAAGHGGQVLLTKATGDLVKGRLGSGFGLRELGEFRGHRVRSAGRRDGFHLHASRLTSRSDGTGCGKVGS